MPAGPVSSETAGEQPLRRFSVAGKPRRMFAYNGGVLLDRTVRRILSLGGLKVSLGLPNAADCVGVWGHSPTAHRGEAIAARRGVPVLRVEDALLRSLHTGRSGGAPIGLMVDTKAMHFDSSQPSDLEDILAKEPLDDHAMLSRAKSCIDRLKSAHISKYNAFDPALRGPDAGYVLVIDQTRGDASIRYAGATAATFREMLVQAQLDHPRQRIVIKAHPETGSGHRAGHFSDADETDLISLERRPVSPWTLLDGAIAVYTVSSGMGFEAILAGHKPKVFGQPFYAGWGLTADDAPVARRTRSLTRAQLFVGAMMLYPLWYDPFFDRLCDIERVIDCLEAEARAWREDHHGYDAVGFRLWKRRPVKQFFGQHGRLRYTQSPDGTRPVLAWAGKYDGPAFRVEDGFLRSKGLGAELVPALSLVRDDLGIYYDPTRESRLERLIQGSVALPVGAQRRAADLVAAVVEHGVSKYNAGSAPLPALKKGHRILVPGQVEDDASIRLGCDTVCTNLDLLKATRDANPEAVILYKPHPDVEAGLRQGRVDQALDYADHVIEKADPIALIDAVNEVWTLTSLLGFEALLRGKQVTCLGAPFYAGWGLTTDRGARIDRRTSRVDVVALAHAVLIAYPRYFDPVTGRACPPEVVLHRLAHGPLPALGPANRLLSKAQGLFSSIAPVWR